VWQTKLFDDIELFIQSHLPEPPAKRMPFTGCSTLMRMSKQRWSGEGAKKADLLINRSIEIGGPLCGKWTL